MSAGVTVSRPYMESIHCMESINFYSPPDGMPDKTSHSWSAVFSSLKHGSAFDSIAV